MSAYAIATTLRAAFAGALTSLPDEQRREQIHQMLLELLDACAQSPAADNIAAALAAFIAPLSDVKAQLSRIIERKTANQIAEWLERDELECDKSNQGLARMIREERYR